MNRCKRCGEETFRKDFCYSCKLQMEKEGISEDSFENFNQNVVNEVSNISSDNKEQDNYLYCAIIYPIIFVFIGMGLLASSQINWLGMLVNLAFSLLLSFSFIKSGLLFYIIPLPIISLYGWKFCKNNSTSQRVCFVLLAILSAFSSIAIPITIAELSK